MSRPGRAALYHRVSTLDQDPTLAREELRRAAQARGLEICLEVEETGSGARNDRPGLQRVLEAARRGQLGIVLVWKLDRFGRSALDLLANIEELQRAGVRFVAVSQGLDIGPGGDAVSGLLLRVLAAVAEFERDLIRDRTRLGLERARRRGQRLGRPVAQGVDAERVLALRTQDPPLSWAVIAERLGCTTSGARRAHARALAEKGLPESPAKLDGPLP